MAAFSSWLAGGASAPLMARMIYTSVKRLDLMVALLRLYSREIQILADPVFGFQVTSAVPMRMLA